MIFSFVVQESNTIKIQKKGNFLEFTLSYFLVMAILLVGDCNILIGRFSQDIPGTEAGCQSDYWQPGGGLLEAGPTTCEQLCVEGGREGERKEEKIGEEREEGMERGRRRE